MSEGELMQIEKARRLDIQWRDLFWNHPTENRFTHRFLLCRWCMQPEPDKERYHSYAPFRRMYWYGFSNKDDLFDYGPDGVIGKPTGIDIKESKMTLPLIHALQQSSLCDKKRIINIIKNHNTDDAKVKSNCILWNNQEEWNIPPKNDGITGTSFRVLDYFPENTYKTSLKELVRYTAEELETGWVNNFISFSALAFFLQRWVICLRIHCSDFIYPWTYWFTVCQFSFPVIFSWFRNKTDAEIFSEEHYNPSDFAIGYSVFNVNMKTGGQLRGWYICRWGYPRIQFAHSWSQWK